MSFMPSGFFLNLNQTVRVQLTQFGRDHHRKKMRDLYAGVPGYTYTAPPEHDGWSSWQLWELMSRFGDVMYHGAVEQPFAMTVFVEMPK